MSKTDEMRALREKRWADAEKSAKTVAKPVTVKPATKVAAKPAAKPSVKAAPPVTLPTAVTPPTSVALPSVGTPVSVTVTPPTAAPHTISADAVVLVPMLASAPLVITQAAPAPAAPAPAAPAPAAPAPAEATPAEATHSVTVQEPKSPAAAKTAGLNVREWARSNGYIVGDKGRMSAEVYAAFEAMTTGAPVSPPKSAVEIAGDKVARVALPRPAKVRAEKPAPKSAGPNIREWARANGYIVGDQGRMSAEVYEGFLAMTNGAPIPAPKTAAEIASDKAVRASKPRPSKPRAAKTAPLSVSANMREWARANGYVVGDQGRMSAEVYAAFEAMTNGAPIPTPKTAGEIAADKVAAKALIKASKSAEPRVAKRRVPRAAAVPEGPNVREWARQNGFSVGETGRMSREIREAFVAAHP